MTNPTAHIVGDELSRKRGDTVPDVIFVTDENGDPADLTGFTYKMTLNSEKDPANDTTQLSQHNGSNPLPLTGRIEFPWTAEQADQAPGKYWYDIEQTDTSGNIKTIAKQKYIFYQDITKA
jgi:hypothetical protein